VPKCAESVTGSGQGHRVEIDAEQLAVWRTRSQYGGGVPCPTQRTIDVAPLRSSGHGCHDVRRQHRYVPEISGHG